MPSAITDLAHYRAARQKPITNACAWSSAFESVAATNIKIVFAWQRIWLRAMIG